ncbi:MAG: PPOX class F420-dependent oxidoreductase [Caldilinea sp. CFX5]|nr:PPOX class F420-dependent oxidoreductase [Caldilinea sp. CFX5]
MTTIPETHRDILSKRSYAHVATVNEEGVPQVTPVWVDYDGNHVLINSAKGRKKDRNMRAQPVIAMSIQDPDNPYRYLGLQGKITEITEEGGYDHINKLSHKYGGKDYPKNPGEVRVIYKIEPTRVWTMG